MVRVSTRLRLCFWLWFVFLLLQSALLFFYSRRALRRSASALEQAHATSASVAASLSDLESRVSSTIEWLHDYADAHAAGADASGSAAAPSPPRVLGYGQNGRYLYADIRIDGPDGPRTERHYMRMPSMQNSRPAGVE